MLEAALGRRPSDLVIQNCRVPNLYTGEMEHAHIHITGDRIVRLHPTQDQGLQILDAHGLFAIPGLMDAHMHVESTFMVPSQLARAILPRGTTTIFADLHEIAAIGGLEGVRCMVEDAQRTPLRLFLQAPSVLPMDDLEQVLSWPCTVSLGETGLSRILLDVEQYAGKAALADRYNRRLSGHAAGLSGDQLSALAALGQHDDHEAVNAEEVLERLRRGQKVLAREGSAAHDLSNILPLIQRSPHLARHVLFCTDDKDAPDILEQGFIDHNLRLAIQLGLSPVTAIQMATLNSAEAYGLADHLGSLTPGRLADILLVHRIGAEIPEWVMIGGKWVARHGEPLWDSTPARWPDWSRQSVHLPRPLTAADFAVHAGTPEADVRVIHVFPNTILKQLSVHRLPVVSGSIEPSIEKDILKLAVVERHRGTGQVGIGFASGFGLQAGAIGSSIGHDDHNLVLVGTNDADLAFCANLLAEMNGGLVVVSQQEVLSALPLPVAGLMTTEDPPKVAQDLRRVVKSVTGLGCTLPNPFMSLSFVPLAGLPVAGFSPAGLVDSATRKPLPLVVK